MNYAQGTFYGQQADQDERGTCSFGRNFANTMKLPWSTGTHNTVALNDNMFNDSLPCGTCIMYRGTGQGIGTTPIPQNWTRAIVNNRCVPAAPSCACKGFAEGTLPAHCLLPLHGTAATAIGL